MPRHRRNHSYRLRVHDIDPSLTYDGIKINPLPFIDMDLFPIDNQSLCLAELHNDHWDINSSTEEIFLRNPYFSIDDEEQIFLQKQLHPLNWLYELIRNKQLLLYYSSKQDTLTLVYPFQSTKTPKPTINLFAFYIYCKLNEKTERYFKHSFLFDDYRSISQSDSDNNAMNTIDFIYQEIQASTMMDQSDVSSIPFEAFLNNDVIRLKDHQIKSSKCPYAFVDRMKEFHRL